MNFAEWSEKRKKETADAVSFDGGGSFGGSFGGGRST